MNDRRRSERLKVGEDMFGRVKATVPARILDLSRHGIQVEIPSALRPAVECDISVPTAEGDLRLRARVRRCRAASMSSREGDERHLVFRAGLEFVEVSPRAIRALEQTLTGLVKAQELTVTPDAAEPPAATTAAGEKAKTAKRHSGPIKIRLDSEHIRKRLEEED
ncbi:MAG: PilZ domain-containing protein [Acidobacteria bacterium]|jgi:hypothetical protein|nr:PilZ domain-containing protein [Acidobacteriota bacterium]